MSWPADAMGPKIGGIRPPNHYGLAVGLLFTSSVVLCWPWLSGRFVIPWDAKAHFWPQLVFLANALRIGDSPFWTPNVFAGFPQIADPQSLLFSPPYLALALFDRAPTFWAADLMVFIGVFSAGTAVILFFRDQGWEPVGAIVAALAIAFGGSTAWRI